jgi:hypothetical protein
MPGKQSQNLLSAASQEAAMQHFTRVGCQSLEEYREWCRSSGLRDTTRKGVYEQQREVLFYQEKKGQESLRAARQFQRKPEEILRALSRGDSANLAIEQRPHLSLLRSLFESVRKEPRVREAFLRLLLQTHRATGFDRSEPVVDQYGKNASNTFSSGLLALARHHANWKREPESWRPTSHNADRQFRDLTRHLLCQYDTPSFLVSAFFQPDIPTTRLKQRWLIQAGNGASLRRLSLPFTLTKRMAHLALTKTSDGLSVEQGWRWVQVLGLGGSEKLAHTIITTRLGLHFVDEPFWETVLQFFVNNPMLDHTQIGPLIDYLHFERSQPRRAEETDRLPPNFTMQGRTPEALLKRMELWHGRLAKEARIAKESWTPSGLASYKGEERESTGQRRFWSIEELTTAKLLIAEGHAMCHCVATYANACARGEVSVWSLRVRSVPEEMPQRVMTIAVNRNRMISEARGKRNALPSAAISSTFARMTKQEVALLQQSRRIVQRWGMAEGIGLPSYLLDNLS